MARKPKPADDTTKREMGKDIPPVKQWIEEIAYAKKSFKPYWDKCDAICDRYKGEQHVGASDSDRSPDIRRYNVLWSMMQTMQPLVYSVPPKPYVQRRFNDNDPAARDASLLIKRGLEFSLEGHEMHDALVDARDDYLLTSRGVVWAKYSPYMNMRRVDIPEGMEPPEDVEVIDEKGRRYYEIEEKVYEEVDWEHLHYKDFLHGAAAKWKHVPWVARRIPMTRKQLIERFGEEMGKKPPLSIANRSPDAKRGFAGAEGDHVSDEERGLYAKAEVWEIWCKDDRKVRWLCPEYSKAFLDEQDDFLELEGFFPCPKPAYGTRTNDSLIPTPDFCLWQDIAMELDDVTHRIKLLTEAMRVVGVYDASESNTLKRITTQTMDNDMIGITNWPAFAEKGGLKGAIEFLPTGEVAQTLERLYAARAQLKSELYEITGISDVVRGASDPRETAKAQQIKGEFANKRISSRQKAMIRMVDECLEIQSEIMAKHYSDQTMVMISSAEQVLTDATDRQPDPNRIMAALQLIRSNTLQQRVKVDERFLVEQNLAEDQEQRSMIMQAIAQLLGQAVPFLEQAPAAGPLLGRLMMFAIRGYPLAQSEEFAIQTALDQLLNAPPKPPEQDSSGPTEAEIQIEQQKLQLEQQRLQFEQQKFQMEMKLREQELMIKGQEAMAQAANREKESQLRQEKQAHDTFVRLEQIEAQADAQEAQRTTDVAKWIGDTEEKAREADMKDEREGQKIQQQWAAAVEKAKADKEKAKAAAKSKAAAA